MNEDLHVLALRKGSERYVFLWDAAGRAELLRTFGRFAKRQDLSFTWYDAATCAKKVRAEADYDSWTKCEGR